MNARALPLFGAAALGFAAAALCFATWAPRPARAQIVQQPQFGSPPLGIQNAQQPSSQMPQPPIEVQALDQDHFVVVTREPRLVQSLVREGAAQNMLLTVVTHYTVRPDRLLPIEHVRVPAGFRLVNLAD
ncbi:MAG: hypothetical protein K0Q72_4403 [Armatimonadetes bacterium]|jgi:hypothetical protein|nr:hypothetical protein [Armatimonadota bacterium]